MTILSNQGRINTVLELTRQPIGQFFVNFIVKVLFFLANKYIYISNYFTSFMEIHTNRFEGC